MTARRDVADGAPMVYVVVLNWNGWRDTIACLESALASEHPRFQIVVCDNGSTNASMRELVAWAERAPGDARVPHAVLSRAEAERGGTPACDAARVVIVQNGANLGFAGGCNVALRYALARGDCAYAWLLNNDTVVEPRTLSALVARARERPDAGLCGSRVLYHDEPERVQAWGGCAYNRWLGTTRQLGEGARASQRPDVERVERSTAYVYGASVLVTRRFLDAVGLMDERYFLYFEELDWATRGAAFARAYAHESIVYHREGRSIGSSSDWRKKSALSDFYTLRNRLVVTRRFFPLALPTVYCTLVGGVLIRLARRQPGRAAMVVRILLGRGRPPALPDQRTRGAGADAVERAPAPPSRHVTRA